VAYHCANARWKTGTDKERWFGDDYGRRNGECEGPDIVDANDLTPTIAGLCDLGTLLFDDRTLVLSFQCFANGDSYERAHKRPTENSLRDYQPDRCLPGHIMTWTQLPISVMAAFPPLKVEAGDRQWLGLYLLSAAPAWRTGGVVQMKLDIAAKAGSVAIYAGSCIELCGPGAE